MKNFYEDIKNKLADWLIKKEKEEHYINKLSNCTTYNSWKKYAAILDEHQENNKWKNKKESSLYDYKELERTYNLLKEKRKSNDYMGLLHILRNCLTRSYCNINYAALYTYSFLGTKSLIEDFILEREKCLIYLFNLSEKELSIVKKIEFFEESKLSYGQTAMVFSGGAMLGLYHIGVCVTLMENDLLPNVICGSSVGSIIAAVVCCLNYEEQYAYVTRKHEDYDGPIYARNYKDSFFTKLNKIFSRGSIHDVEVLKSYCRELLGDLTFKEAYLKTGKILNISVSGYKQHDQNLILNFITAPNVLVFSAAAASSAAPILFNPVELLCKNEYGQIVPYSIHRKQFIDGSLTEDVPSERVRELFNITNFIVSQVNPWVFPFLDDEQDTKKILRKRKFSFSNLLKNLLLSEIIHRLKHLQAILPIYIGRYLNLVTQKFTGDITITPTLCFKDLLKFTTNPVEIDYHKFKIHGSKRVFKRVTQIEAILRTELLLDKLNKSLKSKMNQEVLMAKSYKNEDNKEFSTSNNNCSVNSYNNNCRLSNVSINNSSKLNSKNSHVKSSVLDNRNSLKSNESNGNLPQKGNLYSNQNDNIFSKTSRRPNGITILNGELIEDHMYNTLNETSKNNTTINKKILCDNKKIKEKVENTTRKISSPEINPLFEQQIENSLILSNDDSECVHSNIDTHIKYEMLKRLNNSDLNLKYLSLSGSHK